MSSNRYNNLTPEQRIVNLQVANKVRTWRAEFRQEVKDQPNLDLLADVIRNPQGVADVRNYRPTTLDGIKVRVALMWGVGIGPSKAHRLMLRAGVNEATTLGGLTPIRRRALAQEVDNYNRKQKEQKA